MALSQSYDIVFFQGLDGMACAAVGYADMFPDLEAEIATLSCPRIVRTVPSAYHKVREISGDKTAMLIVIDVYTDETKIRQIGSSVITCQTGLVTGGNPIAAAYLWLKTRSEYAGARDC